MILQIARVLSKILNLMVNVNKCNPMRAVCCIDISAFISHKRVVLNVKLMDNAFFA